MRAATLLCALLFGISAAGLAACGSKRASVVVETVTVPAQQSTPTTQTATTPAPTPTNPRKTRTGPGPAFTQGTGGTPATPNADLTAAEASVTSRGFSPVGTSTYRSSQTLRVLIGASASGRKAFFFDGSRYLGTDATHASRSVTVIDQGDTSVTLRYGTTAGPKDVRFQLDQGRLMAIDTIPPAAARG